MNRYNSPRKQFPIDMTAMCELAFLLLVFFVLTAKPKAWLPVNVNLPSSSANLITDFYGSNAEIIIGEGKVFFLIPEKKTRELVLVKIGVDYKIKFSSTEKNRFGVIETIGTPIGSLKKYIDNYYNNKDNFNQKGIPIEPGNDELAYWISQSKAAYNRLYIQI